MSQQRALAIKVAMVPQVALFNVSSSKKLILNNGETTAVVLCPVLGSTLEKRPKT